MRRQRLLTLLIVIAVVVLSAAISWLAGSNIQSPAEAAARTAAPTPSPILVPVESRVLSTKIVTRGTARYGLPHTISLVPSSLKPAAGIITTLPAVNSQLDEGDVLLTSSGRPVFVLQGASPVFRDLSLGASGQDVEQLEQALERLGVDPGPSDGRYDALTAAALTQWYAAAGWTAFEPTEAQRGALVTLEQDLLGATNDKLRAEEEAATAALAVEAARVRLVELPEDDKLARLEAEVALQTALSAHNVAGREALWQAEREAALADEFKRVRARTGVQLPADEAVFLETTPVRIEGLELKVGDAVVGPVMTVTNNELFIDASLPLAEAPLVRPGMPVNIDEPDLGLEASGVVERVAAGPGTDGADGFHVYFETRVTKAPSALVGFSLRLSIPVESTGGAVTSVPLSAVTLAADGSSRIQIERGGALKYVAVEPGLAAEGFVELESFEGSLTPGDLVVIGYETP